MQVKRWKQTVKDTDTIVHLGDLVFGGPQGFERFSKEIAPQLTGRKYIILGNHDRRQHDYQSVGFTVIKPFAVTYRGYEVTFSHYPCLLDQQTDRKRIHVHGHIHTNGYARGELTRWGNINVSPEVMDYRPHRASRLLNAEILHRNGKQRFVNSRHYRYHKRNKQRRAA